MVHIPDVLGGIFPQGDSVYGLSGAREGIRLLCLAPGHRHTLSSSDFLLYILKEHFYLPGHYQFVCGAMTGLKECVMSRPRPL